MALGTERDTVTGMIVCGQSPPAALTFVAVAQDLPWDHVGGDARLHLL